MSYSGTEFVIPLGQFGLITDLAPTDIPTGALTFARNVTIVEGRVQKSPGARALNSVALASGIIALCDWWPTPNIQRLIVALSNGNIYRDDGVGTFAANGGAALNANSLGPLNPNSKFVSGGSEDAGRAKKLFFFTFGKNTIQVMSGDGVSFAAIASPPTDWTVSNYPKVGILHRNRLWAFAGQIAYASSTADHENFLSDNLVIPCFPGEGGDVIGAFIFKTKMFVFKSDNYGYVLNDSDGDSDNWYWQKFVSNFGISAPNAIIEALNDLLMGNSEGTVTSFNATNALGDVSAGDLLSIAGVENWLRANSSKVGVEEQHAIYYAEKKLAMFTYRSGYYTANDMLVILDLNKQANVRVLVEKKGAPQCLALRKDASKIGRPIYGSSDGKVYLMDREDRLEGASAYSGEFQTPHMDFGLPSQNKLYDFLAVKYMPEGSHNLSCDYYIDGKYIDTITFPMAQYLDPQLGTLLLSTDRLAQLNTEVCIREIAGSGRTISFKFYNAGSNESFQIAGLTVGFRQGGEQAQVATGTEND